MFVSIIIPSYNAENTLPNVINHIFDSDYKDFEIIIIDDNSDRKITQYIATHPKLKITRNNTNKGPAYCRNKGAFISKGDILFFIDSDVYIKRDTVYKTVSNFEKKDIDALVGIYDSHIPYKDFFSNYYNLRLRSRFLQMPEIIDICHGAITAVRRDVFIKSGGFNSKYRIPTVEDLEFGKRLFSYGYRIRCDKEISIIHDKKMNFKSHLVNDFNRTAERVEFIFNKKGNFMSIFKKKEFLGTPIGHLYSILLIPFFWMSIALAFSNKIIFMFVFMFVLIYIYLNKFYLKCFYKEKGFMFALKSLLFIFIDLSIVLLGILKGLAFHMRTKNGIF